VLTYFFSQSELAGYECEPIGRAVGLKKWAIPEKEHPLKKLSDFSIF
jgi:hypothetical protein